MLKALCLVATLRKPRLPFTIRHLNRIFLDRDEVEASRVTLAPEDRRSTHIREIIWQRRPPEPGATLRVGVLDGGVGDCSAALTSDGGVALDVPQTLADEAAPRPKLDVVLALPAPLRGCLCSVWPRAETQVGRFEMATSARTCAAGRDPLHMSSCRDTHERHV